MIWCHLLNWKLVCVCVVTFLARGWELWPLVKCRIKSKEIWSKQNRTESETIQNMNLHFYSTTYLFFCCFIHFKPSHILNIKANRKWWINSDPLWYDSYTCSGARSSCSLRGRDIEPVNHSGGQSFPLSPVTQREHVLKKKRLTLCPIDKEKIGRKKEIKRDQEKNWTPSATSMKSIQCIGANTEHAFNLNI